MHSNVNDPILFKLGVMIETNELSVLILFLNDLDLESQSQGCLLAESSVPKHSQLVCMISSRLIKNVFSMFSINSD